VGPVLLSWLAVIVPHRSFGQTVAAASPDAGKRLFETVCFACHTIGAGVRIGPDLQGVTERRTLEWLRQFIRDPERMRAAGDSIAAANLARYAIRMPTLGLSEQQVEGVIAHLGAGDAAPGGRPPLYLPTLGLALLAAAGITLITLTLATKRLEVRA
jgi:mono/diheme cytochrome c family protein